MKKQTFVIYLEDARGHVVDFERWAYKKVETCVAKMVELYRHPLYKESLDKAVMLVAYPTPDGYHHEAPVWCVSADEFRKMLKVEG